MGGGVLRNLLSRADDLSVFTGVAAKSPTQRDFASNLQSMVSSGDEAASRLIGDMKQFTGERSADRIFREAYDTLKLRPFDYEDARSFIANQGKPLYHGTNSDFDTFSLSNFGSTDQGFLGKGVYLSGRKGNAKQYGSNVIEAYAPELNPYSYQDSYFFGGFSPDSIRAKYNLPSSAKASELTKAIKDDGFNGVNVDEIVDDSGRIRPREEVVVFDPQKVYTRKYLEQLFDSLMGGA